MYACAELFCVLTNVVNKFVFRRFPLRGGGGSIAPSAPFCVYPWLRLSFMLHNYYFYLQLKISIFADIFIMEKYGGILSCSLISSQSNWPESKYKCRWSNQEDLWKPAVLKTEHLFLICLMLYHSQCLIAVSTLIQPCFTHSGQSWLD